MGFFYGIISVMKLSVVIPAYNEEQRIAATLADVSAYLARQSYEYEIIVVVNGSTDRTYEIVRDLEQRQMHHAAAINLARGGKGYAVTQGILEKATGDIIMFMDADNATPISEIEKFLPYFEQGYGVVIGSRYINPETVKVRQPLYRVLLSRLSNVAIQILAVRGIKDTQLGFKAFSNAYDRGYKIKEVAVSWTEHGGGHVPLRAYLESLKDLLRIRSKAVRGDYSRPTPRTQQSHA